ncbi:MAG: magnesium and cobalt transport protein CorA [Actinomycetales bacterium]
MFLHRAVYRNGIRHESTDFATDLAGLRRERDGFMWIGLKDPTEAEFATVDRELGLHPLAVEDAVIGQQRAKVERYDGTILAVVKTLRYIDETSDIETGELMVFLGDAFVVTVRRGDAIQLFGVRDALEADPERLALGPVVVLYAILDHVVRSYAEIDRAVHDDLEQIEQDVFTGNAGDAASIYQLKREVLEFRRAADPLREAARRMQQQPLVDLLPREMLFFFRDIEDNLSRVCDHVDSYDRLLTDVLHAHLAHVGVQQNADMRRISAWVGILAVPTTVAGIYGMNFHYIPGLESSVNVGGTQVYWGYFVITGFMIATSILLYHQFKKWKWL